MNLTEISTVAGAAISAVAVLVSLLLVQRQLRQAHKNQQAMIQQGRASRSAEIAMRLMSADFAESYHACMRGDLQVSEAQLVQFIGYSRAVFLGAEDSFLQHRDGQLDEPAFISFSRSLCSLFEAPGLRAAWSVLREWYGVEFAAYMDGLAREASGRPMGVQHTRWKAALSTFANGGNDSGALPKASETRNAA